MEAQNKKEKAVEKWVTKDGIEMEDNETEETITLKSNGGRVVMKYETDDVEFTYTDENGKEHTLKGTLIVPHNF